MRKFTIAEPLQRKLILKEIFNQFSITFLNFFNLINEVENSGKKMVWHVKYPSPQCHKARSTPNRARENHKFQYKEELSVPLTLENLAQFEEAFTVNCKITKNQIIYFISVPINFKENYVILFVTNPNCVHVRIYFYPPTTQVHS